MCCFSGPVRDVSDTSIFARSLRGGWQLLVYGMNVDLEAEVAMVLPLPVRSGATEESVRFVDLSGCPGFFDELDALYPKPPKRQSGSRLAAAAIPAPARLKVKNVGAFEASFAPSHADLARVDPRFNLSPDVWRHLPEYADWGFAIFKLRKAGAQRVHPMGLEFPRRNEDTLFFPTVHVHDGDVHELAKFEHTLYAQPDASWAPHLSWYRSPRPTSELGRNAQGFVGPEPLFRNSYAGQLPNRDVWLDGAIVRGRSKVTRLAHVRVNTAWELLMGPGRGAPKGPEGLDASVWKEINVPEATRQQLVLDTSARLEAALANEPEVIPLDETLPEVWPDAYAAGISDAPEVPRGCIVKFSELGGPVYSYEAKVAFKSLPSRATRARIAALLKPGC